jgi:hypothetical protein
MGPFALIEVRDESRVCSRCGEPVERGFAFGRFGTSKATLHVRCAIDVDAASVHYELSRSTPQFEGRADALALAVARLEAVRDANRQTKGKDKSAIEPVRDRQGRPRVRVLFLQSQSADGRASDEFFDVDRLCDFWHVRSSLREYALVEHKYPKNSKLDPSQPLAAALYWQRADGAVSNGNGKIVEWKALGLAAPVLAVVGEAARDDAARDKVVAKLRGLLAKCGFEPDDAPAVTVLQSDDATREALALALDEQAAKYTGTAEKRKSGRIFEAIEELFDAERDDGLAQAFVTAFKRFGRSRAEERERVLALLVRFAKRSPGEAAKVLTGVERYDIAMDRAVLAEIIAALVAAPVVSSLLGRWLVRWRLSGEGGEDTVTPMLKAAIAAADGRKAKKLSAAGVEAGFLSDG